MPASTSQKREGLGETATAVFLWTIRASARQIAAAGAVLITSWWVVIMAPLMMQESLHQSVMIVMTAFAARLLHRDSERHGALLLAALVILALSSVLRPTNWIVAVPLVAIGLAGRPLLAAVAAVVAGAGIPGFCLLWRYVSAPIPDLPIELHEISVDHGTTVVLRRLVEQLPVNIAAIFDVREFLQQPFEHVMFESAALIAVFAVLVVRAATARGLLQTLSFKVDLFNALALGMALAAFLGFYLDLGESISRVTAPFLLMTLLLLVATGCRTWIVITAIAVQLLVAPSFVRVTRGTWLPGYTYGGSAAEQFQREMSTLVPYAPDKGPWCNTLLTNTYPPEIAVVPAGIGLTVGYNAEDLQMPVKSKYFLLARKDAGPYGERARLRQLGRTIAGTVYLNLDSACP